MNRRLAIILRNVWLLFVVAGCQVPAKIVVDGVYNTSQKLEREYQERVVADLPPAQPARDLRAIAGKWEGAILLRDGTYPATLTIKEDGAYEMLAPALFRPGPRFVGSVKVVGEKYRFAGETLGRNGTYTLHEDGVTRILVVITDDGIAAARFKPAASRQPAN